MSERERILFVDDEQFVLDGFKRLLREFRDRWQFYYALNGKEALKIFKEVEIDLVIADLRMPEMAGFELLDRIKAEYPSTSVIILTGDHDRTLKRQALDLGADHFLNKPVNRADLVSTIENTLRKTHHLILQKELADTQKEIIKDLEREIENLYKIQKIKSIKKVADRYKAICGSTAHSLKGEFLHIGFANKQIREYCGMSPDILEECDIIDRSMAFSRVLLQQLLDYLDMGNPKMEPIDTRELVKKTELLARPRLLSNINLQITITPNIKNSIVHGNFEQLMGVLLELTNNSSNALRNKGGTIELKVEESDEEIAISVSDNGSGIPAKIRKQLLKKQVPSQSGLGLGLFLSNKVVDELGGKLILKRSSGKGTTFLLLFPTFKNKKED